MGCQHQPQSAVAALALRPRSTRWLLRSRSYRADDQQHRVAGPRIDVSLREYRPDDSATDSTQP
jgi:hypothetical protein